jgi:Integrase core domain/AAA domain, putative AbiEii toxin, Type IV TA system
MSAVVEARIVGLRREHPGWEPSRIVWELGRVGVVPLPGRSSVYRALVRHGLVAARKRRRRRPDYRRWERGRSMELWQMDVMGRVHLADGQEVKVVTGIDDHSRFVVSAKVVTRATAQPVCQALAEALALHGVPSQILTDNGKVLTGRFGRGPGPVMFDRICTDNGIKHLLTAPYSPPLTGQYLAGRLVDRFQVVVDRPVRELSEGNRQKIGLVLAFLHCPELLVLDEPTSGLDPLMQHEFETLLRETAAEGRTVFLSSHELGEVQRIADRIAIIKEGRLVAEDTVDGLRRAAPQKMEVRFRHPVDPAVLNKVRGVTVTASDGPRVTLEVTGEAGPVLRVIARHDRST